MEIQLFDTSISQPSIFKSGLIEGAKLIGADKFQERGRFGEGVTVAIIDSGCDITHPDLKDRIIGVKNFTADDRYDPNNVNDYLGHGTSVASIIGASGNIIGVAPKCNLLILKALSKGGGKIVWVTEAINYAILQGADIINMSLGSTRGDKDMHNAIKKAISKDIMVVVACGNNGDGKSSTIEINYPAGFNECISVGSITYTKRGSRFSASNNEVDLVSMGEGYNSRGILACHPNGLYKENKGTSFSSPFVSGALALLKNWFRDEFRREPSQEELYAQLIKRTYDLEIDRNIQGNGYLYLSLDSDINLSELIDDILK